MTHHNASNEESGLRGRFTVWIEKVIIHAKLHYIRDNQKHFDVISIDELSEDVLSVCDEPIKAQQKEFEFDNERLATAFLQLSPLRRRILVMSFVEEKTVEEIAEELGCSINSVYLG